MTDIFIKSYNRAFYLDRCIRSAKEMLSGDYRITVLDDGTPNIYLDKIRALHPEITIRVSKNYSEKSQSVTENILHGKEIDSFNIPTDLWYDAAENGSDYFIMTEDDVWFTEQIHVDDLQKQCKEYKISLLKLGWLGNFRRDNELNIKEINNNLDANQSKDLFLAPPMLMDWFFYNKFKFFTVLYKLKIFDNQTKLKYWNLNSILMGFWEKNYWLYVWKDARGVVDEKQQLRNAASYFRNHKTNPNFVARLKSEAMKTTFQSSSTNSYHKYGNGFDVNYFNHIMNQAWLEGRLDSLENYPKDFSTAYFESFFDEKINRAAFREWKGKFEQQYINLGCEVE